MINNDDDDYIIIDKQDFTIFESMCIFIENSYELFKKKDWFLLFVKNHNQTQLYIKFTNLNLVENILTDKLKHKIVDQFYKDISRSKLELYRNNDTYIIDNRINHEITYDVIQKIIKKHYKNNLNLFYKTLFLCSQTSLSFIMNEMHSSLLSMNQNNTEPYIIAELVNTQKQKDKRRMKVIVFLETNEVTIEKHLRIIKNDPTKQEMITICNFKLIIYFKIDNHNNINSIVNIQKTKTK